VLTLTSTLCRFIFHGSSKMGRPKQPWNETFWSPLTIVINTPRISTTCIATTMKWDQLLIILLLKTMSSSRPNSTRQSS
jgi:hypothetical protein